MKSLVKVVRLVNLVLAGMLTGNEFATLAAIYPALDRVIAHGSAGGVAGSLPPHEHDHAILHALDPLLLLAGPDPPA